MVRLHQVVVHGFYIDIGNIVCEQDNFVTMNFREILALHIFGLNKTGLEQASDESAGAGKWVNDMHILVRERRIELSF